MKLFLVLIFAFSLHSPSNKVTVSENTITKVYICTGKHSKRYHYSKKCRGLSNCKGDIKEVYLNEAKHKGRTLCGWED